MRAARVAARGALAAHTRKSAAHALSICGVRRRDAPPDASAAIRLTFPVGRQVLPRQLFWMKACHHLFTYLSCIMAVIVEKCYIV